MSVGCTKSFFSEQSLRLTTDMNRRETYIEYIYRDRNIYLIFCGQFESIVIP